MRRIPLLLLAATVAGAIFAPATAFAQGAPTPEALKVELDNTWIIVSAVLVLFMQAGFLFLEIGFSRGKNVGSGVAKIFVNLSIASIAWWAVGYGVSSSGTALVGTSGYFFGFSFGADGGAEAAGMLFGMLFCAVSLAIVWGTTLERIKFGAYVIYAVVFAALIYPLVAHGFYADDGLLKGIGGRDVLDFAGSSVVHLTGAVGGLAALLLLGPRIGKYGPDGRPRAIPGHSMPIVGLGVLILWVGWYGFNAGSTFGTSEVTFAQVALNTQLAAAAGVLGASIAVALKTRALDIGMAGNGAIGGLVGITAPSGLVAFWAAPIIGLVAGILVVFCVIAIEKYLDDPVGALSAHGIAGIWGTLAVGLFANEQLAGTTGLFTGGGLGQLGVQALGVVATFVVVFTLSIITFAIIKATIGLRVSEAEEVAGLDVTTHGIYGYPEQFIPQPEFPAVSQPHVAGTPVSSTAGTSPTVAAASSN